MSLMERVATLLRANVNDLIDRAEEPEKMLKQLVLDMQNQLLQVKTQVAIALADQHLLQKKRDEQEELTEDWKRKATLAVAKGQDELARAALERSLSHGSMAEGFSRQVTAQTAEAESLRASYAKLQAKLVETEAQCQMLAAEHRRARTVGKANAARGRTTSTPSPISRFRARIQNAEADNHASSTLLEAETLEDTFATLERDERVERLLDELKQNHGRMLPAG